jgi:transcriptional regulator with XRE-family HTH domain
MRWSVEVRLKEVASEKGITQLRISQKTGIPETLISKYANGHVLPRVDRALAIADALGVHVFEIWRPKKAA